MHIKFYFVSVLFLLCAACNQSDERDLLETGEPYELLFSWGDERDYYLKKQIINYFKSVALGSEYGPDFQVTKKWNKPMVIYTSGQPDTSLIAELDLIIKELNQLFSDGFSIETTEDSTASNLHIFFGDAYEYSLIYPSVSQLAQNSNGLCTFYPDSDFNINSGHIFVKTYPLTLSRKKHILREELTQSIGLANDIEYYPNSIFYNQASDVQEYSDMDIETIRLLYHPSIQAGINEERVETVLKIILGIQ